jgi:hypothetical protein
MELGLEGQTVTQASADFTVSLSTDANYEVRIETDFSLHTPDGDLHLSLGTGDVDETTFHPLLRQKVRSSVAEDTGTLVLAFGDGTGVRVEPDDAYEAWTIAGPGGQKIVCMPGGELAVWSGTDN